MARALQTEMFEVVAYDPPLRDQRDVMEYPFLSIQKGRTKPIVFSDERNGTEVRISSERHTGLANIWDWDLIVFAQAHVNDAIEQGLPTSPRIQFAPYDALRYMRRKTGGGDYRQLAAAIDRLYSTSVRTTIRAEDGGLGAFRWISGFWIPMQYKKALMTEEDLEVFGKMPPDPARPWSIELTPWLYNSILSRKSILAMHPDYFDLTGGLERWLYRLARKAVPEKADFPGFSFRMDTLQKRSGSTRPLRNFALDVRRIAERQPLPEYSVVVNRDGPYELVTLMRDRSKPGRVPRGLKRLIEGDT